MSDYPITVDTELCLRSSGVLSATEDGTGKAIGPTGLVKCVVFVTAKSGTPTLDIHLEESDTDSGYANIPNATFTQITAVGVYELFFKASKKWIRHVATLGSTTSFTVAIYIAQANK